MEHKDEIAVRTAVRQIERAIRDVVVGNDPQAAERNLRTALWLLRGRYNVTKRAVDKNTAKTDAQK